MAPLLEASSATIIAMMAQILCLADRIVSSTESESYARPASPGGEFQSRSLSCPASIRTPIQTASHSRPHARRLRAEEVDVVVRMRRVARVKVWPHEIGGPRLAVRGRALAFASAFDALTSLALCGRAAETRRSPPFSSCPGTVPGGFRLPPSQRAIGFASPAPRDIIDSVPRPT